MLKKYFFLILIINVISKFSFGQSYTEILGRPTNNAITMSIRFDAATEVYWEYGTVSGQYSSSTAHFTVAKDTAMETDFTSLSANTKYYYRTRYRAAGSTAAFSSGVEHSFYTQRPAGASFSFVVEADPHLDSNTTPEAYRLSLQHMLSKKPDFMIDLGDNFMCDKLAVKNETEITNRNTLFRGFYNELCHSAPLFLTIGNHEGEYGWIPNGTASSLPVMAANIRKKYYPNPYPNNFYSGNTMTDNLVGLHENYYAWEWGDALFMVIDPYWYTVSKPDWGWTLGQQQYNWFKTVISTSKAKFKFVFCHQIVGGNGTEGRGGSEFVKFYEMGGHNTDGTYGFDTNRPGWGKPIHTLLKENGGTIFFHGHDHLFAKQDLDSIVYQEVPQPSAKNLQTITGTEPGYGYANGLLLPNRGYMYITVSSDSVKVDYIRTYLPSEENATRHNGDIGYTYTIKKSSSGNVINNTELVKVFPNPANSSIHLQFLTAPANYVVRLLNTQGQIVSKQTNPDIQVASLPNGMYFLDIETENFRVSKKIIVRH